MTADEEDELLLHVAAETDPLTALAALSCEEVRPHESASMADNRFRAIAWTVLACIGFVVWLLFL